MNRMQAYLYQGTISLYVTKKNHLVVDEVGFHHGSLHLNSPLGHSGTHRQYHIANFRMHASKRCILDLHVERKSQYMH